MKKIICLIFFCGWANAANYITIDNGNALYDIQLIVFARNLPQPQGQQQAEQTWIDTTQLNPMLPVSASTPLTKPLSPASTAKQQLQVPMQDGQQPFKALAWFALKNDPQLLQMVKKINRQNNMRTLLFQTWRQPATPYQKPGYIKISNTVDEPTSTPNSFGDGLNERRLPDFTTQGKVAFSKRRYAHGHVAINLLRYNEQNEPILYRIQQKDQIKLNQWQYFDHQQFGVLMKVNKVNFNSKQEKQ